MPTAPANGIEIAYETFGPPDGRPLLLIMGLAAQMILWDDEFCAALAARGHRVIRFDNRDVGLSTKLDAAGMPDAAAAMQAALLGEPIAAPYLLGDLAGRSCDRCFSPAGAARQLVAILASGSRREALAAVTIPTLVIHGRDDPLIPLEAGLDTARAVPGAELLVIDGMGHDLPRAA